jgi:tRNA-dihydrouridine synthase 1
MVGGSELAFRLLTRKYGATLAYTPMINSARFAVDPAYRAQELQTVPEDRPLVAHFSANDPQHLLAAGKLVEGLADAIDLNLGCPQRVAAQGHFGSFLLDEVDRPLVVSMVRTAAQGLSIPVFVKIRLLGTVEETKRLCEQLSDAGAALIAIHARYRVNLTARSGPGARDGAAHLDQVTAIREHMRSYAPHTKIIANGNIRSFQDCISNLDETRTDGVMSAEALLDNPALFFPSLDSSSQQPPPSNVALALEYLDLARRHGPVKIKTLVFHTRRILRNELTKYQLMDDCVRGASLEAVAQVVAQVAAYESGQASFSFDQDKARREKEAAERRKREEGKRTAFEDRMKRKAKREGKDPLFYLQSENPTSEELAAMRTQVADGGAGKDAAFAQWKVQFSQHCWEFHFNPAGCHRDRTCSFLHADASFTGHQAEAYG